MSGLSHLYGVALGASASAAASRIATLTVDVPVGTVLVGRVTGYTETIETAETDHHLEILDAAGNFWQKLIEVTHCPVESPSGLTASLWLCTVTAALSAGQAITVFQDASYSGILAVDAYEKEGVSRAVIVAGVAAVGALTTTPAVTLGVAESKTYFWLGMGSHARGPITVTGDADFTTDRVKVGSGGAVHIGNTSLWGQYRENASASETLNATLGSNRNAVMILAALEVVENIRAIAQSVVHDTFYGRPILVDEPNWVTPVRQTLDPALEVAGGPAGVWDAARRAGNLPPGMALQAQFTLFGRETIGRWRAFLDRVSGRYQAFWCPGWTAAARLSADAAADQPALAVDVDHPFTAGDWIAVLKHNHTLIASQVESVADAGATLVLASDLPVAVLQTPSRVSRLYLVRLATDDVGMTFRSADIAELTLTVVAVHPDELTAFDAEASFGEPEWQFSERPEVTAPPVLLRPNIVSNASSLPWYRGSLWRSGTLVTDNYVVPVRVQEEVDAIEFQAADSFPVGFQPDEYEPGSGVPFIWDKQNQAYAEIVGSIPAGFGADFVVSVSHGLQTMTPCAFRARTRKSIDGAICYSPWRYWLALEEVTGGPPTNSEHADPVTCGRYRWICANGPGDWIHGPVPEGSLDPFSCPDPLNIAPPAGGWNCQLVESSWSQQSTTPFQWHARYAFLYRTTMLLDFSDRHVAVLMVGRSQVGASFGGSGFFPADTSFVNMDQHPLQLPETVE